MVFWLLAFIIMGNLCAQTTLPSLFPEVKSMNPAVISLRKQGELKLGVSGEKITKDMDVKEKAGEDFSGFREKTKIDLQDANFFYGSRGGGRKGLEFFVDRTSGTRRTNFTSPRGEDNSFTTNVSSSYGSLAIGGGVSNKYRWGLQGHYVKFDSDFKVKQRFDGQTFNYNASEKVTGMGVRPGFIIGSPKLSFGAFYELTKFDVKEEQGSAVPEKINIVGAGLGTSIGRGHVEVTYEADPITKREADEQTKIKPVMPMKGSFIIEYKRWGFTMGYKGMLYKGNFVEADKLVQNQFIYRYYSSGQRLEHMFNLSIGNDRGLTLGAVAGYSNVTAKEKSSVLQEADQANDTKTSTMYLSARIGYKF